MKIDTKNNKYFIVGDVHSFYTEMMDALQKAGFDENNKNHIFVIAGDMFDRGEESNKCYNFLKKMDRANRLIYIRGNHEDLMLDLLHKGFPQSHDFSNGTVKTLCHFAGISPSDLNWDYTFFEEERKLENAGKKVDVAKLADQVSDKLQKIWMNVTNKVIAYGVEKFIKEKSINFIEIDKYIITHSFIPLRNYEYNPNWRLDATNQEWHDAKWPNPFEMIENGKFDQEIKNNKILVFGHWGNFLYKHEKKHKLLPVDWYSKKNDYSLIVEKNFVGLDATTVVSKKVNVFVIGGK